MNAILNRAAVYAMFIADEYSVSGIVVAIDL
jgi:hypothetical protein